MAIITLDILRESSGALLSLDPGTKTLGLAISDRTRLISTPLETIIVGLPLNMDGSHGPRSQSVGDFCTNLLRLRDIPIFMWDERLSTRAVTRTMIEADISRKKRKENVDKLAASYILQGVLDRLRA